ncbi:MAG TPA: amino acid racemase [Caulobacteraceae bacterium]
MRVMGVLGGMGPAATLDFVAKVYAADPAAIEQDRVRLIVDCNPAVPDRNLAARGEGPSPGPALAAMARGLVVAGADFLVIACNTAHAWTSDIEAATDVPVLSMIEAACDTVASHSPDAGRIGLLAGQGCLDAGVYQDAFAARGWTAVLPSAEHQAAFMEALYRIKAGAFGASERGAFMACAADVTRAGAEAIMAGCTEVPLLISSGDASIPMIDATQALAQTAVAFARGPA